MTEATPLVHDDDEPREPRVVVGVDGSAGGRAALLFAVHDAARRGVAVEAVTAYLPPDYWMDFYAMGINAPDQARAAAEERMRAVIAEVLPDCPQPPPPVRVRVERGSAADALVRASHQAELLVVGSRGHGGFTSMLLGSTSMQCVLHAVCPVTVVHSPEAHRERLHLRRRHVGSGRVSLPII
jgi:nucleotide-binding universal stress UspA family protein